MYKCMMDGKMLYYPGDELAALTDPKVLLQAGYAGEFEFKLPVTNPLYDEIQNRKSMVSVYRDKKEIFYGEVRSYKKDRFKNKAVYCAGALSFLADSVQPQAEYHDVSPRELLDTWLEIHNEQVEERKKIRCGVVTVHDTNDSLYRITNFENTLKAIREKLVDKLGGHLRLRHENGIMFLDWIEIQEYGKYCEQPIEFGLNLLDYSESLAADDVITHLIPLGARIEQESAESDTLWEPRVNITSVNNGSNYIYSEEAAKNFGHVWGTNTWDDVHIPSNLLNRAKDYLSSGQFETLVLELSAVDLSLMDKSYESFEIGDRVPCKAKPYGMDKMLPVMEMEIPLQYPENATLKLGDSKREGITDSIKAGITDTNEKTEQKGYVMTEWMKNAIANATAMMTGSNGGYKLSEFDESGRWLRDLYMDAPNKDDAKHLLQINMNGIGFSRTGYSGPYLNAWTIDGVFLGEFIKAHSIKAEALSTEYVQSVEQRITDAQTGAQDWALDRITTAVKALEGEIELSVTTERERASGVEETLLSKITVNQSSIESEVSRATSEEARLYSRITQTDSAITSEVSRATAAEGQLSSRITQTATLIEQKVSRGDVESIISQSADSIRLQASKISWKSTYSSMSEVGRLTCEEAKILGEFETKEPYGGSYKRTRIVEGVIRGYLGTTQYGLLDMSAQYVDGKRHVALKGNDYLHLQAGTKIQLEKATEVSGALTAASLSAGNGVTGTISFVGIQSMNSDGTVGSWNSTKTSLRFVNGILVSA